MTSLIHLGFVNKHSKIQCKYPKTRIGRSKSSSRKQKVRNALAKQKKYSRDWFRSNTHILNTEELCLKRVHMGKTMPHAF